MAVPDIIRPQVESQGEVWMVPRQRQHQVQEINYILYQVGESYCHYLSLAVDISNST